MRAKFKKENTNNLFIYTKYGSYITLYNTYRLWYCKWHIEMTSNEIIINMRAKYKKENKIISLYTLSLEVILYYITLTTYDIVKNT